MKSHFLQNPGAHVGVSKSRPAAGDLKMEDKVIIAVGNLTIQFDQSLNAYRGNTLLATTGSILQ